MLTLQELNKILQLNRVLMSQALNNNESLRRLNEINTHRMIIQDMIIQELMNKVNNLEYKQLSSYKKVG